MGKVVGIDLGTTNSLVAAVDSGIPIVLADEDGQRLTLSVVYYPEGDDDPTVGRAAARVRAVHPERTIYSVKRFMGRRYGSIPFCPNKIKRLLWTIKPHCWSWINLIAATASCCLSSTARWV